LTLYRCARTAAFNEFYLFCFTSVISKLLHRHIGVMPKYVLSFSTRMLNSVSFFVQGLTLPVTQEDKEILDFVILKAETLRQKVHATLGSSLPLQVGRGFFKLYNWFFRYLLPCNSEDHPSMLHCYLFVMIFTG